MLFPLHLACQLLGSTGAKGWEPSGGVFSPYPPVLAPQMHMHCQEDYCLFRLSGRHNELASLSFALYWSL